MKRIENCYHAQFENKEYKKEWKEFVPNGTDKDGKDIPSKQLYKLGTVHENEDGSGFSVYDGATNYIGVINNDGSFVINGAKDEYAMTFMKYAKECVERSFKQF